MPRARNPRQNRLTSASGAGNAAAYAYDAQGRRKAKTVNGTTTIFVTDADNREVMEYSGATGQILRWYAYGLGPNDALGQVDVAANSRATFIPDMLGSVIGVVDGAGALTTIGYAPFGASSAAIAAPLRFTGQRRDAETGGLHYYRARMYAPAWGRFLQVDPIGYAAGANLYAYVGNDPLNVVDPSGNIGLFGAGIGLVVAGGFEISAQLIASGGRFSDIRINTIVSAALTGAAVGFTGGLAATGAAAINLGRAATTAVVSLPTGAVGAVGSALTKIVSNVDSNRPLSDGVAGTMLVGGVAAGIGGAIGVPLSNTLTQSSRFGGVGAISASGKVTIEAIANFGSELIARGGGTFVSPK